MLARSFLAVAALAAAITPAGAQSTWYVDDNAPGDPGPGDTSVSDPLENGSTQHPFDAISEAISAAVNGDTVLILDGTYSGIGNRDMSFHGKPISVRADGGPGTCFIDCGGDLYDSSPHRAFTFNSGESGASMLVGVTIINGQVEPSGGAVLIVGASPSIVGCRFTSNLAGSLNCKHTFGGAVAVTGGHPTFDGCEFTGNLSYPEVCAGTGGGFGGGASVVDGAADFTGCVFSDNRAVGSDSEGGTGCGLYIEDSAVTLRGCVLEDNHADYDGGQGGAIYVTGSTLKLRDCIVRRNGIMAGDQVWGVGGGIASLGTDVEIVNSLFHDNWSGAEGGAIAAYGGVVGLIDTTMVGNRAGSSGGGIAADRGISGDATVEVLNSIVWGNQNGQIDNLGVASVTVRYSDVQDGYAGTGNIDADPAFGNVPGGDYALAAGSPCIDAASNPDVPTGVATDLACSPRFVDDPETPDTGVPGGDGGSAIVDMGAYEFQLMDCRADVSGDGLVDTRDVILFLNLWTDGEPLADWNGDGVADTRDVNAFLNDWVVGC